MKNIYYLSVLMYALTMFLNNEYVCGQLDSTNDESMIESVVLEYCEQLEERLDEESMPDNLDALCDCTHPEHQTAVAEYWQKVVIKRTPLFRKMLLEMRGHEDTSMGLFMRRMLANDPEKAMHMYVVSEEVILPCYNYTPYAINRDEIEELYHYNQIAAAKAQVKMIKEDVANLSALYKIVAWRGVFLSKKSAFFDLLSFKIANDRDRFDEEKFVKKYHFYSGECKYWYARNFLFQCLATSREDLIDLASIDNWPYTINVIKLWEVWFSVYCYKLESSLSGYCWSIDDSSHSQEKYDSVMENLPFLSTSYASRPPIFNKPVHPFGKWKGIPPVVLD